MGDERKGFRRSVRLAALALIMSLVVLPAGGCWDHKELEDVAFVLAMGLDKGERAPLRVTVQVAVPTQIAPGRSGAGPGVVTETVEGYTIDQVMTYMSSFHHKRMSLEHNKIIVFGKDLAMEGIHHLIAEALRDREIRRSNYILVSTGTAAEILQALSSERNPAAAIEELVQLTVFTGLAPRTNLHEWLSAYEGRLRAPVAPVIGPLRSPRQSGLGQEGGGDSGDGSGGGDGDGAGQGAGGGGAGGGGTAAATCPGISRLQVMGTAVFRGDFLVDLMSGEESQVYLMMTGELKRTDMTLHIQNPSAMVTVRLKGEQPRRRLTYEGSTAKIKQTIVFEGDITQFVYLGKYLTTQQDLNNVARQVGEHVRGIAQELVARMQGLGVDPFEYAALARRRLSTYEEWKKFDWPAVYRRAEVSIEVKSFIRRIGATLQSLHEIFPEGINKEEGQGGPSDGTGP